MALRILHSDTFLRSISLFQRSLASERLLSTAPEAALAERLQADPLKPFESEPPAPSKSQEKPPKSIDRFRTKEDNPVNHTERHSARYYNVPKDVFGTLFSHGGLPKKYEELTKVFTETSIMVRKPFLEIKDTIADIDFSKPTVRCVLYGPSGCGKSLTLAHTVHYGLNSGFLLVHVPWVNVFMRRCKEAIPSESKPGMWDVPLNASSWLTHFKTQNSVMLQKPEFITSKEHVWNPRESTPKGVPMVELIQYGITRAKYACDVVEVLLKEIKEMSTQGRCKTMVVIDGFNGLLAPFIITERRKVIKAKSTLVQPFMDITSHDWCNGVVIVSVDRIAHPDVFNATSDLPHYLLGKEGWEHMDPFIPIKVDKFTDYEMENAIDYFINRKWIQHPGVQTPQGRQELMYLSAGIPYELMRICAPL